MIKHKISSNEANQRLDLYLVGRLNKFSRNQIQQAIDKGKIKINQVLSQPSSRLKVGDEIFIDESYFKSQSTPMKLKPEKLPLKILYEDGDVLAIDKPVGLVVHPAEGNKSGTLVNALLNYDPKIAFAKADNSDYAAIRPGIIHRLDKDTSGIVLVAKNSQTLKLLSKQIHDREVEKYYLALVLGDTAKQGEIKTNLARNKTRRKIMSVVLDSGKEAVSKYKTIKWFKYNNQILSLLEIQILTGRTHQIRVQMKHIGHPLIGDQTYNSKISRQISDNLDAKRQMLHAKKIIFSQPVSNKKLIIISDIPNDFQRILKIIS